MPRFWRRRPSSRDNAGVSHEDLTIRLEAGISGDMLDFPWEVPLAGWPEEMIIPLPRGISRHVVRFVDVDGTVMALKEITPEFAEREFRLLRDLEELDIPAVHGVGVVTGRTEWYRLTRFFGKLFLINFAIGVATGIVQEFQFGMNWSEYSRFVGDIFGAPLAMEGLVAFFFESTFIGLWIFGWSRLPRTVHLACIWIVAFAVNASAFFIIAANSFMQHPVGAGYNPDAGAPGVGRAELYSIVDLFTNNTAIWA